MTTIMLSTLQRKSLTTDEYVHIPAAVAHLHGDFRPNAEHPPLAKLIAAVPLTVLGVTPPPVAPAETPTKQLSDAARYFWQANARQFSAISFWSRVPMIALTVALGALIFAFARSHFGDRAAALAVALFAVEPTFLAHGRVVHTDVSAALGLLAAAAAGAWYARRQTTLRAALLGLVLGLTLVTKFSMLPLALVVLVVWGLCAWRAPSRAQRLHAIGQAAVGGVITLLTINACYAFRRQPLSSEEELWVRAHGGTAGTTFLDGLDIVGWFLPQRFLFGAFQQYLHNRDGHPASLLGDFALDGWWYYFPVAFALKVPLPLLALGPIAIGWALWRCVARHEWRILWFLGPLAFYLAIALTSRINIGIRHLLPLFPFLLILAGALLDRLWRATTSRALPRLAVATIVAWLAVETLLTYPHYLTYMNQIARREPTWALLSDSNVEWGDDLGALAQYLRARGEADVVGALLGGRDLLPFHGINFTDYFYGERQDPLPTTRYIAIGASYLNGSTIPLAAGHFRPDYFASYRGREPEAILGRSIYLFRNEPLPVELNAPLPEEAFRAAIQPRRVSATLRAGQAALIGVEIQNASTVHWPAAPDGHVLYQIRLGSYWLNADGSPASDDARAPLPYALAPSERMRLHLLITAPSEPGDYWLGIDLVQEGVTWFGARGSVPARIKVRVEP